MSTTSDDPRARREERDRILHEIWTALARSIHSTLTNPEESKHRAASIQVARQFLADQGVNNSSLDAISGEVNAKLEAQFAALPDPELPTTTTTQRNSTWRVNPNLDAIVNGLPEPTEPTE